LTTAEVKLAAKRSAKVKRPRKSHRVVGGDLFWAYLMIAPLMIGLLIFYIWPTFQTFFFSFTKWGDFGTYHLTGLSNYQILLHDPDLGGALINTLIFTVLSVPASIALSMVIAVLLNQPIRGVGVYRTLYFLPAITMPAAIAMVWRWLYNTQWGFFNYLLGLVHLAPVGWLSNPDLALRSITLSTILTVPATAVVLFSAAIGGVPKDYYEAARLDGASAITQWWRITVPLMRPAILVALLFRTLDAFRVYDTVFIQTQGANKTETVSIRALVSSLGGISSPFSRRYSRVKRIASRAIASASSADRPNVAISGSAGTMTLNASPSGSRITTYRISTQQTFGMRQARYSAAAPAADPFFETTTGASSSRILVLISSASSLCSSRYAFAFSRP